MTLKAFTRYVAKRCEIGFWLLLVINSKWHISF